MYRVALRAVNREYEIDHWFKYADTLEQAKALASKHASHTLGWKDDDGDLISAVGRNINYHIERYDARTSSPTTNPPAKTV